MKLSPIPFALAVLVAPACAATGCHHDAPTQDVAFTTDAEVRIWAETTPLYPSSLRVGVRRWDLAAPLDYDNQAWADRDATDAERQLGRGFAGVQPQALVEVLTGPLTGAPYPRGWTASEVDAAVAAGGAHRSDQWMLVAVSRDALSSDGSDREARDRIGALAEELKRSTDPDDQARAAELHAALHRFAADRDHRLGFMAATKLRVPSGLPTDFGCPAGHSLQVEVTSTQVQGGGYDPVCWHWDPPREGAAEACIADDVGELNLPSCADNAPPTYLRVDFAQSVVADGEPYALDDGRTLLCTGRVDAETTRRDYLFVHDGEPTRGGWVAGFFLSAPHCVR